MKTLLIPIFMLYVKNSKGRGRGIFTDRVIEKDAIIETCPVIIIPANQRADVDKTVFFDYYFNWTSSTDSGEAALPLGYGSLYNHSYQPNAYYRCDLEKVIMEFICLKSIAAHEEIFVNYNGDPNSKKPLWKLDSIDWID